MELHTLTHNIFRQLCDSHDISYTKTDGIDSLFKNAPEQDGNFFKVKKVMELED